VIYSNRFELNRSKGGFPVLENFQIRFGCEYVEIRNNFPYCNFSKFGIELNLKNQERF
jgi:hypothetical protein